ncbi:MAG: hypothetical protein JNL08_01820 [Planctomycetes bacterium]|nr:hypothetical protein [Planctomycetota bacterium]
MNSLRCLVLLGLTAAPTVAQIPHDTAVVLETSVPQGLNYTFVDVFGRGITPVLGQNVFLTPPPVSVATDPVGADYYWFLSTVGLAGTWRSSVGALGRIQQSVWGAWLRLPGQRLEVGASQVFSLRGDLVEACPKPSTGPGQPVTLFQLAGAVDLAVVGTNLYVASWNGGAPAPVVEYHLPTGQQRTVGSYADVRCIAASPLVPELCLGLANGTVQRVDVATGAVTATTATGLGSLVAVGYTRFGTLLYADGQQLWSELVPTAPIHVSTSSIVDFGVATHLVATATPFGEGCGRGRLAEWVANGVPSLGNATFSIGVRNAVPTSFAVLAIGADRAATSAGVPLPLDLQPIGAPGCKLLVDPAVLALWPTNVFGDADQPLPIPSNPAFAGIEWSGQWIVPDPLVAPLGLAITRGLVCAIR